MFLIFTHNLFLCCKSVGRDPSNYVAFLAWSMPSPVSVIIVGNYLILTFPPYWSVFTPCFVSGLFPLFLCFHYADFHTKPWFYFIHSLFQIVMYGNIECASIRCYSAFQMFQIHVINDFYNVIFYVGVSTVSFMPMFPLCHSFHYINVFTIP